MYVLILLYYLYNKHCYLKLRTFQNLSLTPLDTKLTKAEYFTAYPMYCSLYIPNGIISARMHHQVILKMYVHMQRWMPQRFG